MRKTSAKMLRDLEIRVSHLEKKAGPGAGVEVFLSGEFRRYHVLKTSVDGKIEVLLDWHEVKGLKGHAKVEDVTLASYYDTKNANGTVGVIKGSSLDFEDNISEEILEFLLEEEVLKEPRIGFSFVNIYSLENEIIGGGYTRGKAPKEIGVKGEASISIEFETQDGRVLEFYMEDLEFRAVMETTVSFRDAYERLDEYDEEDEY